MAMTDGAGLPVALCTGGASPHETTFVSELIAQRITHEMPNKLIGDKAYDSDPLDRQCQAMGVTLIAPDKTNRKNPKSQDDRVLRRYKRRRKVERLFAWLQNYR
jgi:IS5 family transposase